MDNNNCNCCNNSNGCGTYSGFSIQEVNANTQNNTIGISTGDSRKIRIGNDINLDVTIQDLYGMGVINIKSIKCLIINTTPMMMDLCGNAYEIHRCGLPHYHCLPSHHGDFCGWKDYEYNGFGMYPCGHKNWHCNLHPHYDYFYRNPYGRYQLKCINPEHKPFEFIAPVKALEARNKVRVYFPATAQLLCGLYSLTFIIELYEPGYHCNNLRTVTVDYNNVFELVPNMEGATGNIIIDIDKQIGLNVVDNLNWGNTPSEGTPATEINISGPDEIRVGQSALYTVQNTKGMSWKLCGFGQAEIAETDIDYAIVYGKKISNTVDGYDYVTLMAQSNDGNDTYNSKQIKIHNYAVDVDFGAYGREPKLDIYINLAAGQSVTAPMYVTQEDGTRLSVCERGCNCQAIEAVCASIDPEHSNGISIALGSPKEGSECTWTYDDSDGNTSLTDEYSSNASVVNNSKCTETYLTITNTSSEVGESIVILTSLMKDKDGNFIIKRIHINGTGSSEENPEDGPDEENDIYVVRGEYNDADNSIYLYYHNSLVSPTKIELDDFEVTDVNEPVWFPN